MLEKYIHFSAGPYIFQIFCCENG